MTCITHTVYRWTVLFGTAAVILSIAVKLRNEMSGCIARNSGTVNVERLFMAVILLYLQHEEAIEPFVNY